MTEDRVYAGDIIYDSDFLAGKSRGEIIVLLGDVCAGFFPCYPKGDGERLSQGTAIDTILLLLDVAVGPEHIERFKECLKDTLDEYDDDSDDVSPQSEAAD